MGVYKSIYDSQKFVLDADGGILAFLLSKCTVANGDNQGYVFLVSIYEREVDGGYSTTDTTTFYYAQCVDAAGNELNYLIPQASYNIIYALKGSIYERGVYGVVTRTSTDAEYGSNYTVADLTPVNAAYGKVSASVAAGADKLSAYIYFNDDAKFIYINGTQTTLDVDVTSSIGKLVATDDVYYVPEEGSTVSTVSNVWVYGKKAPTSAASSLLYFYGYSSVYELDSDTGLFTKNPYNDYSGKYTSVLAGGVTYDTYYPYLDGVSMVFTPIPIKSVSNSITINPSADTNEGSGNSLALGYIANGFYAYSVDSNGVYTLTTEDVVYDTAFLNDATFGPDNLLYKGLLTVRSLKGDDYYSFEAFDISSMTIVDVSGATNEYTGRALNVSSVEQIADLIADGKSVYLQYAMTEDDDYAFGAATGKYVPYGVIYVTSVIG